MGMHCSQSDAPSIPGAVRSCDGSIPEGCYARRRDHCTDDDFMVSTTL